MDKIVDRLWDENEDKFLELLRIPSVYDPSTVTETQPYGKPVKDALLYMKDVLEKAGFDVHMYSDQVIFADAGEGPDDERIDIISHLDVVEPGEGWTYPPFGAVRTEGRIYGRGTQDMKSGAWLTYLAVKHLRDTGNLGRRKIRLVYGSDEERTMNDMETYVGLAGMPAFAFSPDGQFPLGIGEKGVIMWVMSGSYRGPVKELDGGIQTNVIPPRAYAVIDSSELKRAEEILSREGIDGSAEITDEGLRITVHGISAHASRPELGRNALCNLLGIICELCDDPFIKDHYSFFNDPYGKGAGFDCDIPPMGKLTMNLGIMTIRNGRYYSEIDCRYPYGRDAEIMNERFREAFPELELEIPYHEKPTLEDEGSPFIRTLGKAYERASGKKFVPIISGGVSYSKVVDNCVTFGTTPEDEEYLAHQKDEYITIDNMKMILGMFIDAIAGISDVK